jgi:hypothetical protein
MERTCSEQSESIERMHCLHVVSGYPYPETKRCGIRVPRTNETSKNG